MNQKRIITTLIHKLLLLSITLLLATLCSCRREDYSDITTPKNSWITPIITPSQAPAATSADSGSQAAEEIDSQPAATLIIIPTTVPDPVAATPTETPTPVPTEDVIARYEDLRSTIIANAAYYDSLDNYNPNTWCFKRQKDHSQSGTYEYFKINDYNGYYVNTNVTDSDRVIYLTFDCGYPSDNTVAILDTLKAHNAKASFFVTKMYLEKDIDYAIRMKQEGHMVCNHTVTHTDLTNKSVQDIAAEIFDCAEYFYNQTGYEFDPFFRTPSGSYTKRLMTIISDAGYTTVFWSIAYGDYDKKNPLAPGYVLDHFTAYHHNGAIALMHNDSDSNMNELDSVLTMLENEGYRFGLLDELNQ